MADPSTDLTTRITKNGPTVMSMSVMVSTSENITPTSPQTSTPTSSAAGAQATTLSLLNLAQPMGGIVEWTVPPPTKVIYSVWAF